MVVPRLVSWFASTFAAVCWLIGSPAFADSILAGTIVDAITQQPVAGADVQVEYSGQTLGAATSDVNGVYRVPFAIPAAAPPLVMMVATARSAAYEIARSSFQINRGTPVDTAHNIEVFPAGVIQCRSQRDHTIIVGNFLPPTGSALPELSRRIARSLDYALNTRLQAVRLTLEQLPSFEDCDTAKPRTPRLGPNFAKALRADAFVGGDVSQSDGAAGFTVSFQVSDAYGLFGNPEVTLNKSVSLDSPSGASMSGETHAAVLASIAAGLAGKNDCVTAITVLSVAERLVDTIPPYITKLRKTCEARVPNAGLRRTTP
jgi:hypothetical protein